MTPISASPCDPDLRQGGSQDRPPRGPGEERGRPGGRPETSLRLWRSSQGEQLRPLGPQVLLQPPHLQPLATVTQGPGLLPGVRAQGSSNSLRKPLPVSLTPRLGEKQNGTVPP